MADKFSVNHNFVAFFEFNAMKIHIKLRDESPYRLFGIYFIEIEIDVN